MKKLMFMLGVVAVAAGVQASVVKWQVTGIDPVAGDELANGYKVYCFCSAVHRIIDGQPTAYDTTLQQVYTALATAETWAKSNGASSDGVYVLQTLDTTDDGAGGYATSMTAWSTAQSKNVMKGATTSGNGAMYGDFFAIITDKEIGEATQYWIASADDVKFGTTSTGTITASLANSSAGWQTIGSPTPVIPEPTSGLLLLLGVAGLALRRKQK